MRQVGRAAADHGDIRVVHDGLTDRDELGVDVLGPHITVMGGCHWPDVQPRPTAPAQRPLAGCAHAGVAATGNKLRTHGVSAHAVTCINPSSQLFAATAAMGDSLDALMSGINVRHSQVPLRRPAGGTAAFSTRPPAGGVGMLPSHQRRRPQDPAAGLTAASACACARPQQAAAEVIGNAPSRRPYEMPAGPPRQLHSALFPGQAAKAAAAPSHAPPAAPSQVGIPAHGYAAEQNARFRNYMEDDRAVVEGFGGRADRLFAAVYDGHGGRLAVDFITAHLHEVLAAELRASRDTDMQGCLSRAFLKTDRMLLQAGTFRVGSTAACCVFERDVALGRALLHTAKCAARAPHLDRARHRKPCTCSLLTRHCRCRCRSVGDTRVVLLGGAATPPRCLSVDHLPTTNAAEVARVEAAGGRVAGGRVGGLAVSRALGDHALKDMGVIAVPDCTTQALGGDDRYVLLASDGVWDVLSLGDAHALVLQHEAEPLAEIAQRLVQTAVQKGSRDNVSAMLLDVRSFR